MKLDDGLEFQKASLDITPLIDVVFLLVLFFAVTTSFISPEDLEDLKRTLTELTTDKTALSGKVSSQELRISELAGQGDALRTRLQFSLEDLERVRREVNELSVSLGESERRAGELDKERGSLQVRLKDEQAALQNERRTAAALQTRLQETEQTLDTERASSRQRLGELHADLDSSRRQAADVTYQRDLLQVRSDALSQEKSALDGLRTSLEQTRDNLQRRVDELTRTRDTLEQQANALVRERDALSAKAVVLNREKGVLAEKSAGLESERTRLAERVAERERQRDAESQRAAALSEDLASARQRRDELAAEKTALSENLSRLSSDHEALSEALETERKLAAERQASLAAMRQDLQRQRAEGAEYKRFYDANQERLARTDQAEKSLSRNLNAMLLDDTLNIDRKQNQLIINLSDKILFDSGRADIKPEGLQVLARVGAVLKEKMRDLNVRIGGHTDNVPVRGRFGNNWELSAARAVTVVKFLEKKVGIDPGRLSSVGFGEHRPIASNDTAKGRAMNRRIELVLLPK